MSSMTSPQKQDWDRFWSLKQSKNFSKISWSKRRIIQVMGPYLDTGKGVLDAGCGSGFFSKYFCDQGLQTTAFDYSKEALDMAKNLTQGQATLASGDLLDPRLNEILAQRFDVIFSDGVFEHFSGSEQDQMMQNLKSVLNPGGHVITFVPNRWSPWELIRPIFMPGIDEEPFVLKELVDLNTRNGLTVVQSGGVNTLPFYFSLEGHVANRFGMLLYSIAST